MSSFTWFWESLYWIKNLPVWGHILLGFGFVLSLVVSSFCFTRCFKKLCRFAEIRKDEEEPMDRLEMVRLQRGDSEHKIPSFDMRDCASLGGLVFRIESLLVVEEDVPPHLHCGFVRFRLPAEFRGNPEVRRHLSLQGFAAEVQPDGSLLVQIPRLATSDV